MPKAGWHTQEKVGTPKEEVGMSVGRLSYLRQVGKTIENQ